MKSKVVVGAPRPIEKKYPVLAKACSGSYIVLFHKENHGMVVSSGADYSLGEYSQSWHDAYTDRWEILPENYKLELSN